MEARVQTPTLKESTIVERVARIVSSVRGTKPDYTHLAAELEPAIPFDVFGVVLLRHDRQAVRVTVCQHEAGNWVAQYHLHPLTDSMVERVLHAPETIIENYPDGLNGPPATCGDALSACPQLRAILIAPLVVGEQVLGTLELGSTIPDTYADETLQRLIAAVVRVLAAAIESAQMGGSAQIQDRQRQALKGVSSALASEMDLSSILNQIVDGIANALSLASAIITLDQREHSLRLEAQVGLDPLKLQKLIRLNTALTDRCIIGYTLRHRQPRVSNDISADERFPASSAFMTELGVRSIFSYPLVTGTTVYGALLLCSSEPGGFTPLKSDILSLFASQATIAIHNGMLIESTRQRSRFQKAIEQLEHAYEQNVDEQEVLAHVRQEAQQTFGVSFSSLLHFISDHLLTRSERDFQAMLLHTTSEDEEESGIDAGQLVLNMRPAGGASLQEEDGERDEALRGEMNGDGLQRNAPVQEESVALLTQTAEEALARVEVLGELDRLLTQLKQSSDHMKDAWFVIDLNGLCFYMNPAAKVFCGLHIDIVPESTLEDIFAELMPRIRNAEEVREYLHSFSQGNMYRQDLLCVLADEAVHGQASEYPSRASLITDGSFTDQYYQLARYPLGNAEGILRANVLQVQDVTAQVRDEKNKSALLSSVSHELRTPLTTIKAGVSGLLQTDIEWDEQTRQEILEEVNAEADHLDMLVNGLVEMSRIEMGALILHKEWCDVVEVVHGTLIRLERVLAGRHCRTDFQANLAIIYADYVQLERVFTNLIEYAANRSSSDAEIGICIDTVYGTTDKVVQQFLRVKIISRGYGTSANEREHILKAFYGLNLRGSGLGLAISRGIIEAHEGQIGVEAIPGGDGSCVVFTLPMHTYNGRVSPVSEMIGDRSPDQVTPDYDLQPARPTDSHSSSFYASSSDTRLIASTEE
ncbi:MAG: GAF domain-containing protein, partial [Ktedonobacteraceae bacterium]